MNKASNSRIWKSTYLSYGIMTAISILYIYMTYAAFIRPDDVFIGQSDVVFVKILLTVPLVIIWFVGLASVVNLQKYTRTIKDSADGKGLSVITGGILLILAYIVVVTMSDALVYYLVDSPLKSEIIVVKNHVSVLLALAASYLLFRGSRIMAGMAPMRPRSSKRLVIYLLLVAFFIFVSLFGFYAFSQSSQFIDGTSRFVLPVRTLLLTYALPHVAVWVFGMFACINLYYYSKKVHGFIYKMFFRSLYRGILLVFIASYLVQMMIVLNNSLYGPLTYLVLILAALTACTVGFILIYHGSAKLYQVEQLY